MRLNIKLSLFFFLYFLVHSPKWKMKERKSIWIRVACIICYHVVWGMWRSLFGLNGTCFTHFLSGRSLIHIDMKTSNTQQNVRMYCDSKGKKSQNDWKNVASREKRTQSSYWEEGPKVVTHLYPWEKMSVVNNITIADGFDLLFETCRHLVIQWYHSIQSFKRLSNFKENFRSFPPFVLFLDLKPQ